MAAGSAEHPSHPSVCGLRSDSTQAHPAQPANPTNSAGVSAQPPCPCQRVARSLPTAGASCWVALLRRGCCGVPVAGFGAALPCPEVWDVESNIDGTALGVSSQRVSFWERPPQCPGVSPGIGLIPNIPRRCPAPSVCSLKTAPRWEAPKAGCKAGQPELTRPPRPQHPCHQQRG